MKYKQIKPISLEALWVAADPTRAEFLKEWAMFMNWFVQAATGYAFSDTWGKLLLDRFISDMIAHSHGATWLSYMERHGFIAKEFEPFNITLRVESEEEARATEGALKHWCSQFDANASKSWLLAKEACEDHGIAV